MEEGVWDATMSRQTFVLLLVAVLCALVASVSFLLGPLFEPSTREAQGANEGFSTGGWLVIAAIAGAVFTWFGGFLTDLYARRREERLAEREAEARRQQWDREDRTRREDKEEADRRQIREQRARSYKAFAAATTFPAPFEERLQGDFTRELNERYTDALLYCSNLVVDEIDALYTSALTALSEPNDEPDDPLRVRLEESQRAFWNAVRYEAGKDYSHS